MVLWEGVGWKKVGMGELIVPSKVKVVYMKGIAKVHPDKVCDGFFTILIPSSCFPPFLLFSFLMILRMELLITARMTIDTAHSHNRTAHDQRSGLRGAERSVGWIQTRERALTGFGGLGETIES